MNNQTHILISKLKQQPKQGMAVEDSMAADAAGQLRALTDTMPAASALIDKYAAAQNALNNSSTALSMGLGKLIGIQDEYAKGILSLTKNVSFLEEANKKLNKNFGLSSTSAQQYANRLRNVANSLEIGSDKVFEYATNLRGLTAGFIQSNKAQAQGFQKTLLKGQTYMLNNLKVTEAAAEGYEYYATAVADSGIEALAIQDELAKVLSAATGIDQLSIQKDLTEEIGNLTADLQMQYSRIPGSLELAVLKSRALGMSLENLNSAGQNLLNIESSIGQEMEYQLLSGKRLLTQDGKSLTNAYRMATIEGNADKQAELMNQLLESQGDILEKNMFARKKAAELLGTDEATIARSIQKRKILSDLGAQELMNLSADKLQPEIDKLKLKFKDDKSKLATIDKLLKESDTRTTEEIQADLLAQIRDNTMQAASTGIDIGKIRSSLTTALTTSFKPLMTQFDSNAQAIGKLSIASETIGALNAPLTKLTAAIPVFGERISTAINKLTDITKFNLATGRSENDAIIMNDGIVKFNPADKFMQVNDSTMIAGTNVDGNKKLARAISGGGTTIDYNKMAMAIATALQNIKVEATVKPDMLFAATKMNGKRGF